MTVDAKRSVEALSEYQTKLPYLESAYTVLR